MTCTTNNYPISPDVSPSVPRAHRVRVRATGLVYGPFYALVYALVWLVACGGPQQGQQKTDNDKDFADMEWKDTGATADKAEVSQTSQLSTGESLIWRFSLFGIELGRLALAVGDPGAVDGKQVAIAKAKVETTKMAAVFAPVDEELTTFVDVTTLQPVYHRREVAKGTMYKWVETKLNNKSFAVTFRERGKDTDSRGEQSFQKEQPIFDANSLLLAARAWNMEAGQRIDVNVFREIFVWNFQIERTGEETIKVPMGEFPAIRFDAIGRRLKRDGSFDESIEARKYSFWLSDDNKRLPLMLLAKTDYGDARMELVEHGKAVAQ